MQVCMQKQKERKNEEMKRTNLKGAVAAGLASAMAVLAPGCASIESSSPSALAGVTVKGAGGPVREHIMIDTTGYYLFNTLPLVTGDVRWDAHKRTIMGGTSLFRNHVREAKLQDALVNFAKSRNCDLADVSYSSEGETLADINNTFLGVFLGKAHMCVSATLVPRK